MPPPVESLVYTTSRAARLGAATALPPIVSLPQGSSAGKGRCRGGDLADSCTCSSGRRRLRSGVSARSPADADRRTRAARRWAAGSFREYRTDLLKCYFNLESTVVICSTSRAARLGDTGGHGLGSDAGGHGLHALVLSLR